MRVNHSLALGLSNFSSLLARPRTDAWRHSQTPTNKTVKIRLVTQMLPTRGDDPVEIPAECRKTSSNCQVAGTSANMIRKITNGVASPTAMKCRVKMRSSCSFSESRTIIGSPSWRRAENQRAVGQSRETQLDAMAEGGRRTISPKGTVEHREQCGAEQHLVDLSPHIWFLARMASSRYRYAAL